jgi:hypothetical protein
MSDWTEPTRQELTPPKNRPLNARFCDQTFAFSELARGLSSSANCLAFLPRSSLGWLFVGFSALQFTEKAFPLKLLFQNPQCLIDIIVTNENFQSGFLSRLNSNSGARRLLRCGLKPCRQSRRAHFVGVPHTWASARSCRSSRASKAAVAASQRASR